MLQGQPKGLYALALANTGERFGYYTMLAIFTLFLQAKFGFTAATTSTIFASFLAGVYFMPLIGGILADKFGYGKMVTTGIVIMFAVMCCCYPDGNQYRIVFHVRRSCPDCFGNRTFQGKSASNGR